MKQRWIVGLAPLALAIALPSAASTFVALSDEEMVRRAKAVVVGRVAKVDSFWNEAHTAILTEALLEVEEVVLGEASEHVVLRTFGGEVAGYRVEAHGFPTFAKGQRLLVFLTTEPRDGSTRILGYRQGQFRVVSGPGGEDWALPALDDGDGEAPAPAHGGEPASLRNAFPLPELKRHIGDRARQVGRSDLR